VHHYAKIAEFMHRDHQFRAPKGHNMQNLPAGVHVLSAESQAALARAKAKGDAIAARHVKPERLAAASHRPQDA
jgi:hypothetical protein